VPYKRRKVGCALQWSCALATWYGEQKGQDEIFIRGDISADEAVKLRRRAAN